LVILSNFKWSVERTCDCGATWKTKESKSSSVEFTVGSIEMSDLCTLITRAMVSAHIAIKADLARLGIWPLSQRDLGGRLVRNANTVRVLPAKRLWSLSSLSSLELA
jgi:hypothetical protein